MERQNSWSLSAHGEWWRHVESDQADTGGGGRVSSGGSPSRVREGPERALCSAATPPSSPSPLGGLGTQALGKGKLLGSAASFHCFALS